MTSKESLNDMQSSRSVVSRQEGLPSKEATIFKSMVRFYEHKQYKKSLKSAEQILKKFPEHGETLAMKGLVCHFLGRLKEESFDLARKGIRSDINSPVCWHVFGLLHRANKNYEEAIKCYLNALRHGRENLQILRDLSLLQIQMRNYEGYQETRHQLLSLKPQNKASWIGLAIAYHLTENFEMAIKVLEAYEGTLSRDSKSHSGSARSSKDIDGSFEFELSEILLYKGLILLEAECYQESLDQLLSAEKDIYDKKALNEFLGMIYLKLDQVYEAQQIYKKLIIENPECIEYYKSYIKSHGIDLETSDEINKAKAMMLLESLSNDLPKSYSIQWLLLQLAVAQDFEQRLEMILHESLLKGISSTFASLKCILDCREKQKEIENGIMMLEQQQQSDISPQKRLWTYHFLAQFYDKKGQSMKALSCIESAISLDSTIIDLFMTKARILKHSGDTCGAAELMNKAREMDLADRYINTKCAKYMIRNGQLNDADRILALFLRDNADGPDNNLVDMQCMWYALEMGEQYYCSGNYGMALKHFHRIDKYFAEFIDDQFDFHTYFYRKMTLRAYIRLLRFEDSIYGHQYFIRAAKGAIRCYLDVHDHPKWNEQLEKSLRLDGTFDGIKGNIDKGRTGKPKLIQKASNTTGQHGGTKQNKENKRVDEDPQGRNLIEGKNVLEEALVFFRKLRVFAKNDIECWILGYELFKRLGKPLLQLHALRNGLSIDINNPDLYRCIVDFLISKPSFSFINESIAKIVMDSLDSLTQGQTVLDHNRAFLNEHRGSPKHLLKGAEARLLIDGSLVPEVLDLCNSIDLKQCSLEIALDVHSFLQKHSKTSAELFKDCARQHFSLATQFK